MPRTRRPLDDEPDLEPERVGARISKIISRSFTPTDADVLLSELIDVWGGPRALARSIRQEFDKASPGGMTRQRILEMFQRLVINNTNSNLTRVRKPSQMSHEELIVEAKRLLFRVAQAEPEVEETVEEEDDEEHDDEEEGQ